MGHFEPLREKLLTYRKAEIFILTKGVLEMSTSVRMYAGNTVGGIINGNWGTYSVGSDGTFLADTRDVAALLALGAVYVNVRTVYYGQTPATLTATIGKLVASGALSAGALAVANQPDVIRQGAVVWSPGTVAITAGSVSFPYVANDGSNQVDVMSLVSNASVTNTYFLTKGVVVLSTPTVSSITGGGGGFIEVNTTGTLAVPVDGNVKTVTFLSEYTDGGKQTLGTPSTLTVGAIAPTIVPNGTHTYGWLYTTAYAPDQ